jgi:ribonuclease G
MDNLVNLWLKICDNFSKSSAPKVIHKDLKLVQRIVRDVLTEDVNRLLTNSIEIKDMIVEYVELVLPEFKNKIFYEEENFIEKYNINKKIEQALRRKVWLKNGAYLVIDQMEALTAIDINTGKYVGKNSLKETVFETNILAVSEIVHQLRLRNIGGIIVIDFIDMEEDEHKQMLLEELEKELKKDKTKTIIMGITQLGLVEMTRKKSRQGLESLMMRECPYCDGKGKVLAEDNIFLRLRKEIRNYAFKTTNSTLIVKVHPLVADFINNNIKIEQLEKEITKKIIIKSADTFHFEQSEIITA